MARGSYGVDQKIIDHEASVVRRIFAMYADGPVWQDRKAVER